AALHQPVGVDEARRVVVDVRHDVVEEALRQTAAHGSPSSNGASRPATSVTTPARSRGACRPWGDLTKSSQRADDSFMPHHDPGAKTARTSSQVPPIVANNAAMAPRASAASIGTRASS